MTSLAGSLPDEDVSCDESTVSVEFFLKSARPSRTCYGETLKWYRLINYILEPKHDFKRFNCGHLSA